MSRVWPEIGSNVPMSLFHCCHSRKVAVHGQLDALILPQRHRGQRFFARSLAALWNVYPVECVADSPGAELIPLGSLGRAKGI